MSWEVNSRTSSGKILRVKSRYPESFKFLWLRGTVTDPLKQIIVNQKCDIIILHLRISNVLHSKFNHASYSPSFGQGKAFEI